VNTVIEVAMAIVRQRATGLTAPSESNQFEAEPHDENDCEAG
jgi:hypothetical protein